jgi:hypothetical protein
MMLCNGRIGWVGVLVICLGGAAAPARAQGVLRYKFQQGEKLNYEVEQKINMQMNVMGNNVTMDMTENIDTTWDIKSVDKDGKAKMTQKFDRVRFTMTAPMPIGRIEYDSKDGKLPEGPFGQLLGPFFEAMAGSEFTLSMDATGKVSDVVVPEKFTEAMKKVQNPGAAGGDMFSPEGMKNLISQSGLVLPNEAATKGKTWERKVDIKSPLGKMETVSTNTFAGSVTRGDKKLEQVDITTKLTLESDPNAQISAQLKSQEAKGKAYFDPVAGRVVETGLTQTMEMAISARGQEFTQKIDQTLSMKLK